MEKMYKLKYRKGTLEKQWRKISNKTQRFLKNDKFLMSICKKVILQRKNTFK